MLGRLSLVIPYHGRKSRRVMRLQGTGRRQVFSLDAEVVPAPYPSPFGSDYGTLVEQSER